jgi:hypothetical protein
MSVLAEVSIEAWSAWAPGLTTWEAWNKWALHGGGWFPAASATEVRPPVQFMPPLLRRRCSDGARAALSAAYACLGPALRASVPVVFASRHGEAQTTLSILQSVAQAEPLSPMDFSLSVHNASSGIFSIATGNTAPASAIAARQGLVASAILEGLTQARSWGSDRFLCVFQEEPVPSQFLNASQKYPELCAFALLCREDQTSDERISLIERVSGEETERPEEVEALAFLRWWLSEDPAGLALSASLEFSRSSPEAWPTLQRVVQNNFFEPGASRS